MYHARGHRLSSTELRGGRNGSRRTKKNAGAAAASYRRHGSRRHGCIGWSTLPSGHPGCVGSKGRRGRGLGDDRLAQGASPTAVGNAHGAAGIDGEAGSTVAVFGDDAGGAWRCCERVTGRSELDNLAAERVASRQQAGDVSRRTTSPRCAGRAWLQSFGDDRRRRRRERAERRQASATATGGRHAAGGAVARAERRRNEEATTGSDTGPRTSHLR